MSDISEIRNKLGVADLDKSSREKLLQEFKKAGGVVLDDESHSFVVDKEKQKEWLEKTEEYYTKTSREQKRNDALWKYEALDIWTYIRALLAGVITFSGKFVRKSFFLFFQKKIMPVLRHSAVIISNIFQIDLDYNRKIEYEVRNRNENGFDVLEKYRDLYSDGLFAEFLKPDVLEHRVYVKSKLLLSRVSDLLKKIYILRPYEDILISSLKIALEYEDVLLNTKNGSVLIMNLEQEIKFVFHKFFNKLFLLFEIMTEHKYNLESDDLDEVLEVHPTDKVGYYVEEFKKSQEEKNPAEKEDLQEEDTDETADDESESEEYSEEEAERIRVLAEIPYNEWAVLFSQTKDIVVNFNDKAFVLYVLMREFEDEYSFVLSTTKIKINMIYSNRAKIDYRNMLNNLYVKLDEILDSFRSYFEIIKDMRHAHELDEIEMFNRMQVLNEKKQKVFRSISMEVFHFFQSLAGIMSDFLKNLNNPEDNHKIIENPDDTISFDAAIEGNKKLNHYKIIDILHAVYLFSEAVLYELDDEGILAGDEPELQTDYLETVRKRQKYISRFQNEVREDGQKEKFVVDELEEILK